MQGSLGQVLCAAGTYIVLLRSTMYVLVLAGIVGTPQGSSRLPTYRISITPFLLFLAAVLAAMPR